MTRSDALRAALVHVRDERMRLTQGIGDLQELYRELLRAYAPPNVQFERERIIAQLSSPREIAFVLGLLSEGENEAALLLELMCDVIALDPETEISHIVDEAWYYLRTSIDATWQIDDGPASASAALVYLHVVLHERLQTLMSRPAAAALSADQMPERVALLKSLRDEFSARATGSDPR